MNALAPSLTTRALWYVAKGETAIRTGALLAPKRDEVLVRTLYSALSRGTERLVFNGLVGESEWMCMACPAQVGSFPFPVKYGYCAVGIVENGPHDLIGRPVFALHPHQDRFIAPVSLIAPVPGIVSPRRAILAASMETALNALWDAGAGPADRIVVVGGGVVGLCVTYLAARLPGAKVTLVDTNEARRPVAEAFGARFSLPDEAPGDADIVFHVSASASGLATAIASAGLEAAIVEMSWYGDRAVSTPLGGVFHSRRLKLMSSQVGQVSLSRRSRWPHARRLAAALDLLADDKLDALITHEVDFDDLPAELPRFLAPDAEGLAVLIRYS